MPESTHAPVGFPDGGHTYFGEYSPGPVVSVRFPDGGLAEFRPASEWPRYARVQYRGLTVKGLPVDIDAGVEPGGKICHCSIWKTDVAGIDGGNDIPAKVQESVMALCRKRAREARDAISVVSGRRNSLN